VSYTYWKYRCQRPFRKIGPFGSLKYPVGGRT
jgi:hypothetical protein